jgi:hypothetical protein
VILTLLTRPAVTVVQVWAQADEDSSNDWDKALRLAKQACNLLSESEPVDRLETRAAAGLLALTER